MQGAAEAVWCGLGKCRRRCLVANRATLPQTWPRPPRNVAGSCELTVTIKPTELFVFARCGAIEEEDGQGAAEALFESFCFRIPHPGQFARRW